MNDKQRRQLEIVSRIDDDILEKNTQKRIVLMRSNKRKRWILSITAAAAALALIATSVVLLVALLGKQVPIYTGMTVSNEMPINTLSVPDYNAPGNVHGDQAERGPVDQAKPFPNGKKPIDDAVKDSLSVTGSDLALYYAKAGEYVYITVHVDNPDSFEIVSFTLNGYKYANNMFEYGSDLENLILKVKIPEEAEGITSYTIDAIKYIDGEKIKDVRMNGDKTVDIAVYMEEQPTATFSGESVDRNSISFSAAVTDAKSLLAMSEGKLYAVLYDGDSVVATKELALGTQTVTFDGLATNTLYQYAVIAIYDAMDGVGVSHHVLSQQAVYTKYVVLFHEVQPTPYAVSFSLLWDEAVTNKTLLSLALYQGESKLRDLAVTDTAVDGLASDSEYRLVATYQNGNATESIEVAFSTAVSTVTLYNNGVRSTESLLLGQALPTPVRQGFTFAGWFTAEGTQITTVPAETVSVFAKWAEEAKPTDFYYTISGGKVTLTGLKSDISDLIIPAYIEGCPVTKLNGDAFKELDGVIGVHLPETLTEIGVGAFSGCTGLEKIVLPASLRMVGGTAFADCDALECVEYTGAFADWLSITFSARGSNPVRISNTLYINGVDITDNPPAIPAGLTVLGNWALAGFDGLTDVVIPTSVHTIGRGALMGCNNVVSLTTPVLKVTFNLGVAGMESWDGLQYLFEVDGMGPNGEILCEVPDTLTTVHIVGATEIPDYTYDGPFYGFDSLTTVTLPEGLQRIGIRAFNGCGALTAVNIPTTVTEIGGQAFAQCSKLSGIELPAGLQIINMFAFSDCTSLTAIDLPDGLLKIDYYAFEGTALTEITIPASVETISGGAFKKCAALETVTFAVGSRLTTIGDSAFAGCGELTELVIPASVTSLDQGAFAACYKLKSLTLPIPSEAGQDSHNPIELFYRLFDSYELAGTETVPASLATVIINGGTAIPDRFFDNSISNQYTGISTIILSAGIAEIGTNAFYGCTGLKSVEFPASLTKIGTSAFFGCTELTELVFNEGLKTIGQNAFYGCSNLARITLPASFEGAGSDPFFGCTALVRIDYLGTRNQWDTLYEAGLIRVPLNDGLKLYINNEDSGFW